MAPKSATSNPAAIDAAQLYQELRASLQAPAATVAAERALTFRQLSRHNALPSATASGLLALTAAFPTIGDLWTTMKFVPSMYSASDFDAGMRAMVDAEQGTGFFATRTGLALLGTSSSSASNCGVSSADYWADDISVPICSGDIAPGIQYQMKPDQLAAMRKNTDNINSREKDPLPAVDCAGADYTYSGLFGVSMSTLALCNAANFSAILKNLGKTGAKIMASDRFREYLSQCKGISNLPTDGTPFDYDAQSEVEPLLTSCPSRSDAQ